MKKVFVIAEAGVNHNGELKLAKQLVDMAVDCGADAVKFQTFKTEEIIGKFAEKANYQKENTTNKENQFEMVKKLELPFAMFKEIKEYCLQRGITFISTPDGEESLNYLVSLNVPLIKIGSTEITNLPFLEQIGNTMKPIILSTGMSTLGEVETALDTIYATGNTNVRLMHCTTDYPTGLEDVNLKAMITMRQAFNVSVGLSDHTLGFEAAIAAVALGAEFIEKHITLDRNMEGPDHRASMPSQEFKKYVEYIRNTELLLGNGLKKPTFKEQFTSQAVRRSIVAKTNLREGTVLEKHMLTLKRPGNGLPPYLIDMIVGRKLKRNILEDELIQWKDV